MMRYLSHSNNKGVFQLSYCEDRQHPASVTSAKFEQTVITAIRIIAETENSETRDVDIGRATSVEPIVSLALAPR